MYANRRNFRILTEIGVEKHYGDVRFFSPEVEIRPVRACAMHPAIIIEQFVHYTHGYGADAHSTERISSFI